MKNDTTNMQNEQKEKAEQDIKKMFTMIYFIKVAISTLAGGMLAYFWAIGIEEPAIACICAWTMMSVSNKHLS